MDRRLFATLQLGSRLYGTSVEGSDDDILELYLPTTDELVANRVVRMPQCIRNGIDTRQMLLGDFVMSLGTNTEHMVLAYQYHEIFSGIQTAWLNHRALTTILNAAQNMWDNAKTPKNRAHAYRYLYSASQMSLGIRPLYPMTGRWHADFMSLRNDEPNQFSQFHEFLNNIRVDMDRFWKSENYPNRQTLSEWVIIRYLGLHA